MYNFSYEKIRVVGKGAFGNAVLYRRKDDGLMCIIKVFYSLKKLLPIRDHSSITSAKRWVDGRGQLQTFAYKVGGGGQILT